MRVDVEVERDLRHRRLQVLRVGFGPDPALKQIFEDVGQEDGLGIGLAREPPHLLVRLLFEIGEHGQMPVGGAGDRQPPLRVHRVPGALRKALSMTLDASTAALAGR